MNTILDDFKNAWSKPNNGLIQLIIINVAVFVILGILAVVSSIIGVDTVFILAYKQFTIPAPIGEFLTRPWTIITYAFAHSFNNLWHILMNMLVLYWFGRVFVDFLGSQKLINLYVMGAIAGGATYLLVYNLIPYYSDRIHMFDGMVGASAAVYAISVATATYWPDHKFFLMFFGPVKIKYLVGIYIFTSFLGSIGPNAGGNLAHLGGALIGFIYAKQLTKGIEMGTWVFKSMEFIKSFFVKSPTIKVSHRQKKSASSKSTKPSGSGTKNTIYSQAEIDKILDKISEKGYDSLSKDEKEKLFNASKK
ncbi:MAG: rhomboid family intramembrane serine protease [Cyclobacteriaceae bacterium]|nr:rhomboid family intramembrane serine protease [Cyclobacteriaceae bacterium]